MPRETVRCPKCSSLLGRPPAVVLVQCPRCGETFELPPDDIRSTAAALKTRLLTRPATEDEDAPPRPVRRLEVDLSGGFRVEPWRWLRLVMDHWAELIVPYVGFLLVASLFGFCGWLFELLFRVPLACGAFLVGVRILRREPWTFETFFAGFDYIGQLLGTTLVHLLWLAGAGIYLMGPLILVDSGVLPRPLAFALITPFVATAVAALAVLYVRCSFANALIVEQGQGVREALRNSWRMTRGHFWGLLGYYALLYLLGFAGLMGCGVGLFLALPLISLAQASAYLHATGQVRGHRPSSAL